MADIKGTNIASAIAPFTDADAYPTHSAIYGKGGYKSVATIAERDAIPTSRLEEGCVCYVKADGNEYRWTNNAWVAESGSGLDVDGIEFDDNQISIGSIIYDNYGVKNESENSYIKPNDASLSLFGKNGISLNTEEGSIMITKTTTKVSNSLIGSDNVAYAKTTDIPTSLAALDSTAASQLTKVGEDIGNMSELDTDATNLVGAINEVASKPSKPEAGWAKTDLDTSVQASINKADKVGDWSDIDLPVEEGEAQPENVVAALNMISGVDLASQFDSRYVQAEGYADGTEQQSRWGKYRAAEASRTSAFNTAKTQKLSSYDTEFATLKAGYIPETLTSITGDVLDNKYYRLGTITSLDIDGLYEDDDEGNRTWLITHGTVIEFTAGTDADGNVCPITFPCQVYVNKSGDADSIGSLSAGIRYQMLLSYDNVTFVEFNSSTVNA